MDTFIRIYDDAIPKDHCESLINFIDKLEECDSLGSSGEKKHLTNHKAFNASHNYHTTSGSWLGSNFLPYIQEPVNEYLRNYKTTHKIGTIITFKYMGLSDGGVPRHPQYLRIRLKE